MIPVRLAVLLVTMCAASIAAVVLKPSAKLAEDRPKIDLESVIPDTFGKWKQDMGQPTSIINPQQKEMLDALYSQTLSRTYVSDSGDRIMLSLAYGAEQNREMQVHRPETCYPAQGFQLTSSQKSQITTVFGSLPVMRLVAIQGVRHEPITYWIRVGDRIVRGNLELGFARVSYGLRGTVPDGLLVRVSSLSLDSEIAFQRHDQFIMDLLSAIGPAERQVLLGAI
jgi:EpsI family protein